MRLTPLIHEIVVLVRTSKSAATDVPLDVPGLRSAFGGALSRMHRNAQRLGVDRRDLDDMGYALVAWIDEVMIARGGSTADGWKREQLQLSVFGENTAGEGFFVRLEALRRTPRRAEVLAVYYVVLALGFKGRYAVQGDIARQELVESVRSDLERYGALPELDLAPHAGRSREPVAAPSGALAVLAIGGGALGLATAFYAGLWLDLAVRLSEVIGTR